MHLDLLYSLLTSALSGSSFLPTPRSHNPYDHSLSINRFCNVSRCRDSQVCVEGMARGHERDVEGAKIGSFHRSRKQGLQGQGTGESIKYCCEAVSIVRIESDIFSFPKPFYKITGHLLSSLTIILISLASVFALLLLSHPTQNLPIFCFQFHILLLSFPSSSLLLSLPAFFPTPFLEHQAYLNESTYTTPSTRSPFNIQSCGSDGFTYRTKGFLLEGKLGVFSQRRESVKGTCWPPSRNRCRLCMQSGKSKAFPK